MKRHSGGYQPIKDLIEIVGALESAKISILIDSGATNNFISRHFVEKYNLDIFEDQALKVRLADGNELSTHSYTNCVIRLGSFWTHQRFEILNAEITTIFGMPFLEAYNPIIDWKAKTVQIPTKNGVTNLPTIFSSATSTLQ